MMIVSPILPQVKHPKKLQHILVDRKHNLTPHSLHHHTTDKVDNAPGGRPRSSSSRLSRNAATFDIDGTEHTDFEYMKAGRESVREFSTTTVNDESDDDTFDDEDVDVKDPSGSRNPFQDDMTDEIVHQTLQTMDERTMDRLDCGNLPRGDASMVVKTESGSKFRSKYRYHGFGMWENTDVSDKKPVRRRKKKAPPPPPKIMYECRVVSLENKASSFELDQLKHSIDEKWARMAPPILDTPVNMESGIGAEFCSRNDGTFGSRVVNQLWQPFDKEDMSDMFRRAFNVEPDVVDSGPAHRCAACTRPITDGKVITTVMKDSSDKDEAFQVPKIQRYHPQCFVCTYCKSPFKERKYKSGVEDSRPYCFTCFEKLYGHFGKVDLKASELF